MSQLVPPIRFTPIRVLQYQFLKSLILCNKKLTIGQAIYRIQVLNEYEAKRRLAHKQIGE